MDVRIKFKTAADAERVAEKLPVACHWQIVKDKTTDAYLQVPEDYEDYIKRYLLPKKNTYYKVVTRISLRNSSIRYCGEVIAEEKPKNTYEFGTTADTYTDYFDTQIEAEEFVTKAKKSL